MQNYEVMTHLSCHVQRASFKTSNYHWPIALLHFSDKKIIYFWIILGIMIRFLVE
jgi:hypothetical protein